MLEPEELDGVETTAGNGQQTPVEETQAGTEPEPSAPIDGGEAVGDKNIRSGETDRVNGEYHYKNGYTQRIYADAHYVPAGENTVPPRYYTPPEKQERAPKPRRPRSGRGLKIVRAICMCLVCALLGGFAGAAVVGDRVDDRISGLEERLTKAEADNQANADSIKSVQNTSATGIGAGGVYDIACRQVVSLSSEVSYQSMFGVMSSPVSGSGFIISDDGYILTNYHVVEQADKAKVPVTVTMYDGSTYEAAIVGTESSNDIAVLKIDANNLDPVTFGDSDKLSVGDEVYPVGNPLGELEFSMSTGHISALDRLITTKTGGDAITMFQMDAAVNSGNSGGPVYDSKGEVVGIVTAKYEETGVEGIGFAIPINDAKAIAEDLITKGYVTGKAYMGVSLDNRYNSMYSQYYGMPIGAYVASVESGSCAEKAGLQPGDIITGVGESTVESYDDLRSAVKSYSAGDSAEVEFYRAGESQTVTVTFDEAKPDSVSETPQ